MWRIDGAKELKTSISCANKKLEEQARSKPTFSMDASLNNYSAS